MDPEQLREIEKLYHAAREREPADLAAFLDQACRNNEELRRKVELMLAQDAASGQILDGAAVDVLPFSTVTELRSGQRIGPYEVGRLLGRGGMGEVFEARDTRLGRTVAIKMLASEVASASQRRRFQQEAKAASALNHPHILTVHEAGEWEGRQYLVTEFVDGGTLKEWNAEKSRGWREAVELMSGVADGLACAHEAGILHRDIKPQNILVMRSGYAKLADFGLAKQVDVDDLSTVTRPGTILGTIAYMSPEQAQGKAADARSDVFSFGVVLYELLSGRRPFDGGSQLEALHAVIHETPKPLQVPGIPGGLKATVEKAIEKDPASRHQTMREFATALRRIAREPGANSPARVASRGPTAWVIAITALLAAVVAGGALWKFGHGVGAAPIRSLAVLPLQNLSGDPSQDYFSDGTTEELISTLAQIRSLRVISRTSVMRYKNAAKGIPEIGQELGVDAVVTGSVRRSNGRIRVSAQLIRASTDSHLWANEYERDLSDVLKLEAEVSQAIAQEIRAQVTPQEHAKLAGARTVNPAAREEYLQGRYHSTKLNRTDLEKAAEHFERAIALEPGYAEAWAALSGVAFDQGVWAEGPFRRYEAKARSAAQRAVELDPTLSDGHGALCLIYTGYDWKWDAADRECRKAIELDPNNPMAYRQYSLLLMALGRGDESVAQSERAARFDPASAESESYWGRTLYRARRYDEAIRHYKKAIALEPQGFGAHARLADAYLAMGRTAEALAEIEETKGLKDAMVVKGSGWLASAYARAGKVAEARALLRSPSAPNAPTDRATDIASAYIALGEIDKGLEVLQRAFDEGDFVFVTKAEPQFDRVRNNPRFQALIARLGIPDPK